VHAVLRRTKPPIEQLRLGNTVIDFKRLQAYCGAKRVELTDREFEILQCLAERAGHVVTRDELLHLVWGYSDAPLTRTVDNFILRLRHKLEPDPRHPTYIRKAYGDGYRLIVEYQGGRASLPPGGASRAPRRKNRRARCSPRAGIFEQRLVGCLKRIRASTGASTSGIARGGVILQGVGRDARSARPGADSTRP
jgi:DNA-binding winged helix-turn-helix (wHTH) protein